MLKSRCRVREASCQIEQRLRQEPSMKPHGLIAIDISKTVNRDGTLYFSSPCSHYLSRQVDTKLEEFLKRNRRKLTSHLHPRVSAVLVYLRTPAVIETEELLTNFRRLYVMPSARNDGKNKNIHRQLENQFEHEAPKNIFQTS